MHVAEGRPFILFYPSINGKIRNLRIREKISTNLFIIDKPTLNEMAIVEEHGFSWYSKQNYLLFQHIKIPHVPTSKESIFR